MSAAELEARGHDMHDDMANHAVSQISAERAARIEGWADHQGRYHDMTMCDPDSLDDGPATGCHRFMGKIQHWFSTSYVPDSLFFSITVIAILSAAYCLYDWSMTHVFL